MSSKTRVADTLARTPIFGVVRTTDPAQALELARTYIDCGLELIEITFTVPGATELVRRLLDERGEKKALIGMGTVTDTDRVHRALAAGAEFLVSPNTAAEVAEAARPHGIYLVLGALTVTEIVAARKLGADLVKVYPLSPVGGPAYLSVIRGPISDVPMLAAGGFEAEEIPAYRRAGAIAFGLGAPQLLGATPEESRRRIQTALAAARGEERS